MSKKNTSSKKQQQVEGAPEENRAWFITLHIASMIKAGLTKEQYMDPPTVAKFFKDKWENSGKGREAGIVVCISADGKYHIHGGLYGNTTTFHQVKEVMCDCHIEEQKANKKQLTDYLRKNPPYDEKGETVLYELGLECIKDAQGKQSIYKMIDNYLALGMTPSEIMGKGTYYRKYEKLIKSAYMDKRIRETPVVKDDMYVEFHFGQPGTGKTYFAVDLYKTLGGHGKVYLVDDYQNGGFDKYLEFDAPPVLCLDDFKGIGLSYGQLLSILDRYSIKQTHSRYINTFNLWTQVYMTSVYSIEELFQIMVEHRLRKTDSIQQLLRRINTIVYHYIEDGEFKTFSMPASEYKDSVDMIARIHSTDNDFQKLTDYEQAQLPFEV